MEVVSGDGDCGNGRGLTNEHWPMLVSARAGWGFFIVAAAGNVSGHYRRLHAGAGGWHHHC